MWRLISERHNYQTVSMNVRSTLLKMAAATSNNPAAKTTEYPNPNHEKLPVPKNPYLAVSKIGASGFHFKISAIRPGI
jgi:hypothetical protein